VIPLMQAGKILPYLDIPFQHASPKILKAMKRPAAAEDTLARIRAWRAACPELVIRSTFIVGFPGETEEDFQMLLDFLEAAQLDRVGCFPYSAVEGAAANALPGQVPEDVKLERLERFMEIQAEISAARLERRIGQTMTVLVDEITDDGTALARSYADAPEIDGVVIIENSAGLEVGEFAQVRITDAGDHDLWAERV
jgi:ribosomal protein S12 methylthiotransferase